MNLEGPTVSVIVPVYNVEAYLDECIQSLLHQIYTDYEVILVDDGSTDRSGLICDRYADQDQRLRCFHKKNGGLSDARNYGVRQAKGEWISFVDSDDYVSSDYLEYLVGLRERYDADVSIGNMTACFKDRSHGTLKEICMGTSEALERMMYIDGYGVTACCKLYNREMIKKYPYPPKKLYEDLDTTYKIIGQCKKIVYGNKNIYVYRYREDSIRRGEMTKSHLYGLQAAQNELSYMKEAYPQAVAAAEFRCGLIIIDLMTKILEGTSKDKDWFRRLKREMRPYFRSMLTNPHVKFKFKIRVIAIMLGYYPMRTVNILIESVKRNRSR